MATLLQAIQLAERLEKSHIKVLKWFIQNGNFEGSYRELAENIYGNAKYASNVHKYVTYLADMGLLVVAVNSECNCFDTKRTYIYINKESDLIDGH